LTYITSLIIGFLVGSFPTAYIAVKRESKLDIRREGSGNVGARNAYEVTGSKWIGVVVLIVDLIKGIAATLIGAFVVGEGSVTGAIAGIGAILGHNYSPWLKFKGGRGLATTAGMMLLLCWSFVANWLIAYFILNYFVKNVHVSTVLSTIICLLILWVMPAFLMSSILMPGLAKTEMIYIGSIITILIILKHINPLKEYILKVSQ
jgi:acyl phosphate:glycerol-3-phosphate acyltransferase